uniref:Uncharacterized protein n=1 Tax=Romanomermis culicivorax TaxID=13658 RepID=A0A915I3G8_ROMCU
MADCKWLKWVNSQTEPNADHQLVPHSVMLVPMEQVKKMSFQLIGVFPNKTEDSPPQTGFLKPICPLGDAQNGRDTESMLRREFQELEKNG